MIAHAQVVNVGGDEGAEVGHFTLMGIARSSLVICSLVEMRVELLEKRLIVDHSNDEVIEVGTSE